VLSGDGRFLVSVQFLNDTTNGGVHRYDLQSGDDIRVDRVTYGGSQYSGGQNPSVSADGRWIAFEPTDHVAGFVPGINDANGGYSDVVLADLSVPPDGGRFRVISVAATGYSTGNRASRRPRLSPDANWIVFESQATDLVPNGASAAGLVHLYARDLVANRTRLLSVAPNGQALPGGASEAAFSANSRYVAFCGTTNGVSYRHDLLAAANTVVCTGCRNPTLSAEGRWIAFETVPSSGALQDIFVADMETGLTELVSVSAAGSGGGDGNSFSPCISSDGQYVVFASQAGNLVPDDVNHATDLFVRDRANGVTFVISRSIQGPSTGNAASPFFVLGADGRTVVFRSFAGDLVPGDYNDLSDIFVLRLGEPSPRIITLTPAAGGPVTIFWAAFPGKNYVVQFRDTVDAGPWTDLPGYILATGTTATHVDVQPNPAQRFYRVIQIP
jgi:Tol biopolymer transport system component